MPSARFRRSLAGAFPSPIACKGFPRHPRDERHRERDFGLALVGFGAERFEEDGVAFSKIRRAERRRGAFADRGRFAGVSDHGGEFRAEFSRVKRGERCDRGDAHFSVSFLSEAIASSCGSASLSFIRPASSTAPCIFCGEFISSFWDFNNRWREAADGEPGMYAVASSPSTNSRNAFLRPANFFKSKSSLCATSWCGGRASNKSSFVAASRKRNKIFYGSTFLPGKPLCPAMKNDKFAGTSNGLERKIPVSFSPSGRLHKKVSDFLSVEGGSVCATHGFVTFGVVPSSIQALQNGSRASVFGTSDLPTVSTAHARTPALSGMPRGAAAPSWIDFEQSELLAHVSGA